MLSIAFIYIPIYTILQEQIKYSCKSSKNGVAGMHASTAMGLHLKIIFFQTA